MRVDFPAEARLERAIGEVRDSPVLQVLHERHDPVGGLALDVEVMFETLEEVGFSLDDTLRDCYLSRRNLALQWQARGDDVRLVGEFDVKSIAVCPELPIPVEDFIRDESQRPFLSQLHTLDEMPRGGSGRLVTVRFFQGDPGENPEIWLLDRDLEFPLDLDYCGYLANLAITKGASGWQYLFADVALGEHEFGYFRNAIGTMLDIFFPDLFFPGHDYGALRDRLEERL